MRAEVVAVGSEMLTPTHVDTNSLFITERLNELGIDLQGKAVAGDDRAVAESRRGGRAAPKRSADPDRGLGPTDDDLTRDVVADLIGQPLEYHAEIFEPIDRRFTARGLAHAGRSIAGRRWCPRARRCCRTRTARRPGLWIEHEAS